jgi:hypothetical protein
MNDIPCKCGHYQNVHLPVIMRDNTIWTSASCMYCQDNTNHEFELDNLSLIEAVAEEKGLVKKGKKAKNNKPWSWPFQRYSDGPEYACPHGVGHSSGTHGCDHCCRDPNFPPNKSPRKINKK